MRKPLHLNRFTAAGIAGGASAGVTIQFYFNIHDGLTGNGAVLSNLTNFISYFTIETNIALALVLAFSLARVEHPFVTSPSVRSALVVYIIVVGTVYAYLLSHLYRPQGLRFVANLMLHDAVPVLYPLYWLCFIEKGKLRWRDPLRWLIFPCAFFAYSMARGAAFGVYPYPFIDADRLGYVGVGRNALLLLVLFLGLGVALTGLDHFLAGKRQESQPIGSPVEF